MNQLKSQNIAARIKARSIATRIAEAEKLDKNPIELVIADGPYAPRKTSPVAAQIRARSNTYWQSRGATKLPPKSLTPSQQAAQRNAKRLSDAVGADAAIKQTVRLMRANAGAWAKLPMVTRHELATNIALLDNEMEIE